MNIRPKTKRRLLVLLAALVAMASLFAAVFVAKDRRNNASLQRLHDQAMEAYRAGDYPKAVGLLESYRDKTAEPDPEAILAFAKSRARVPLPQGRHLAESIRTLTGYLESIRPGDEGAEHELLKIYILAGYNVEACHLADTMLEKNPRDPEVLWQKVWGLVGQSHFSEALEVNLKLNEIEPLNLQAQEQTLGLMAKLNDPPAKLIEHAKTLHDAHDQDPRFEVLFASAYMLAHKDEDAQKWLQTAATHAPPDAQFVVAMVASLDKAGLYPDAADFLTRAGDALSDPQVQHLLVQRLWQNGKAVELESRLKSQDPAVATSDGLLVGYRALAIYAQNKYAEASKLVEGLGHRTDAQSAAWAMGLKAAFSLPALNATERVTQLQQAVTRDGQNPVLHLMLAQSYLRLGEADLTIQQCDQAYQLSPSWAMPHVVAVDALIANDRNNDAVATAREAFRREPDHYDSQAALARANFSFANDTGLARDYAALVPLLQHIQETWHGAETLPMYVTALARGGKREEAIAATRSALKSDPAVSTAVLTQLAAIADAENLDLGAEVREAARKAGGQTPQLAYAEARALLAEGKSKEALASLLDAAKSHEDELAWRMVIADYKEVTGQDDALANWIALGDQHPENLQVQQTILRAPSRMKDRAFWERSIDRLKKLTGEQGIAWRIERSRWLLSGDLSEREKAEAVNLLTQVTHIAPALAEPHRLLAVAMEKVSNTSGAITELSAAADARPGDPTITHELVGLLLSVQRNSEAMGFLDRLARSPRLTPESRQWVARTYSEQGANDKALATLNEESPEAANQIEHRILLARLDRRAGKGDDAAQVYSDLLDAPIEDSGFWIDTAEFFADRHDLETANRFLDKLANVPLAPGELEVDRGQFAERWVSENEAAKNYQAATVAAPRASATWGALAGFHMRHGKYSQAAATAGEGLKSLPDNVPLKKLQVVAESFASLAYPHDYQILGDALAQNPIDAGLNEMLAAVVAAQTNKLDATATAQSVREVADRHLQNIAASAQAIQCELSAGSIDAALELARAASKANQNAADPQRLLAEIYANTGDWTRAERSALLWRERTKDHPMAADLALARIYLRGSKKDPAAAINALASHVSPADPAQNPAAFNLYLTALVLSRKSDDAAGMLKPLVAEPSGRATWLGLADSFPDADSAMSWIDKIRPALKADSADEQYTLANAQYRVGVKFDSADALLAADKTIAPILSDDNAPAKTWMLAAQVAHARADYPAAEKAYRRVLKTDSMSAPAMNNLAYVLWLEGNADVLPEARKLAESAVAIQPTDASFHDTLARIQDRIGDRDGAIQSFRNALRHDSNSLEAMIGLADLLSREPGTRDQAKDLILRIRPRYEANPHIAPILRQEYEAARDAVASSF